MSFANTFKVIGLVVALFPATMAYAEGTPEAEAEYAAYDSNFITLSDCVDAAETLDAAMACVRGTVDACRARRTGGMSNAGAGGCMWTELTIWQEIYDEAVMIVLAGARDYDTGMRQFGSHDDQVFNTVLEANAAWAAYRDLQCSLEVASFGAGTAAGQLKDMCLARLTAVRIYEMRTSDSFGLARRHPPPSAD